MVLRWRSIGHFDHLIHKSNLRSVQPSVANHPGPESAKWRHIKVAECIRLPQKGIKATKVREAQEIKYFCLRHQGSYALLAAREIAKF